MAKEMAGGANTNSISVAMPAKYPPVGPNARKPYANGPPAWGIDVVNSV